MKYFSLKLWTVDFRSHRFKFWGLNFWVSRIEHSLPLYALFKKLRSDNPINPRCLSFWISPDSVLILIARDQACFFIRSFRWKGTRQRPEFDRLNGKGLLEPCVKATGKGPYPRDPPLFEQKRRTGA